MEEEYLQLYIDEIEFLLTLKQAIGRLNNRIHDKLALIAIEKLKPTFPMLTFHYANAGAAGIDIRGLDRNENLKLIAEVKTTLTSQAGSLRGPQKRAIERDLQRLSEVDGQLERYFVVLSRRTKEAIERQLDSTNRFPSVRILNALDDVDFVDAETEDEES